MLKKVMVILNIEKLFLMFFSPVKKSTIQLSSLDIFIEHLIFLEMCIFKIKLTYFFFLFTDTRKFYLEDICLITLLKGMCLKFMNFPEQAEECFKFVITKQGQIIKDTYLIPYAQFELALKIKSDGQLSESLDLLEKTK